MPNKSASDLGTFRRRTLEEFAGVNLLLTGLELVSTTRDGKALQMGPFYTVHICVDETGEMVDLAITKKDTGALRFVSAFLDKAAELQEFPIAFTLNPPVGEKSKARGVGDWEEA